MDREAKIEGLKKACKNLCKWYPDFERWYNRSFHNRQHGKGPSVFDMIYAGVDAGKTFGQIMSEIVQKQESEQEISDEKVRS